MAFLASKRLQFFVETTLYLALFCLCFTLFVLHMPSGPLLLLLLLLLLFCKFNGPPYSRVPPVPTPQKVYCGGIALPIK